MEPALQVLSGSSFRNAWEQSPDSKAQGQSSGWRKRTPALVREGRETDFTQNTPLQLAAGRGWVQVGVGKMVAPKAVPRLMLNQASESGLEEDSPWADRGGVRSTELTRPGRSPRGRHGPSSHCGFFSFCPYRSPKRWAFL